MGYEKKLPAPRKMNMTNAGLVELAEKLPSEKPVFDEDICDSTLHLLKHKDIKAIEFGRFELRLTEAEAAQFDFVLYEKTRVATYYKGWLVGYFDGLEYEQYAVAGTFEATMRKLLIRCSVKRQSENLVKAPCAMRSLTLACIMPVYKQTLAKADALLGLPIKSKEVIAHVSELTAQLNKAQQDLASAQANASKMRHLAATYRDKLNNRPTIAAEKQLERCEKSMFEHMDLAKVLRDKIDLLKEQINQYSDGSAPVLGPEMARCRCCGGQFKAKKCKIYCSKSRLLRFNKEAKQPSTYDKECPQCKTGFTTAASDKKFCSDACLTLFHREKSAIKKKEKALAAKALAAKNKEA